MKQKYFKIAYRLWRVFIAAVLLFMIPAATIGQQQQEARIDQVRSAGKVQGRLDSVREEKIVITYEPKKQKNVQLQTYYLRDESTKFINQNEKELKAGDIIEITYEENRWKNARGKKRVERIAKEVRFIHSRAVEELRKKAQQQGLEKGRGSQSTPEMGPQ